MTIYLIKHCGSIDELLKLVDDDKLNGYELLVLGYFLQYNDHEDDEDDDHDNNEDNDHEDDDNRKLCDDTKICDSIEKCYKNAIKKDVKFTYVFLSDFYGYIGKYGLM